MGVTSSLACLPVCVGLCHVIIIQLSSSAVDSAMPTQKKRTRGLAARIHTEKAVVDRVLIWTVLDSATVSLASVES